MLGWKSMLVTVAVIVVAMLFILPLSSNVLAHIGTTRIPLVSDLTYKANIQLPTSTEIRYNIVSWHVELGMFGTPKVTLYYLGGQTETFQWVLKYSFTRSF